MICSPRPWTRSRAYSAAAENPLFSSADEKKDESETTKLSSPNRRLQRSRSERESSSWRICERSIDWTVRIRRCCCRFGFCGGCSGRSRDESTASISNFSGESAGWRSPSYGGCRRRSGWGKSDGRWRSGRRGC
ncbi:hypothetical protein AAC387_Pa04g1238 [Persea americana]